MWFALSVSQRLLSGPSVIASADATPGGSGYSVKLPPVVMRPSFPPCDSTNHSAPSGPAAILLTPEFAVGTVYSVIVPAGADADGLGAALLPPPHETSASTRSVHAGIERMRASSDAKPYKP